MSGPPLGLSACRSPETLLGFLLGELPEVDLEDIARHLSGCRSCRTAVDRLDERSASNRTQQQVRRWLLLPLSSNRVRGGLVRTTPPLTCRVLPRRDGRGERVVIPPLPVPILEEGKPPMSTPVTRRHACPGREALLDFLLGRLPDEQLVRIAAHLETCPSCTAEMNGLHVVAGGDNVERQVRACLGTAPSAEAVAWADRQGKVGSLAARTMQERTVAAELPRQTQVGNYLLLEKLGGGGMGSVYRAVQQPIGRVVALKMIRSSVRGDPRYVARFRTEGKAVARLRHPNVVEIYAFDEYQGLPYFTMELVEGPTLAAQIATRLLGPHEAASLLRTLALAIEYAHQQGVLHRDLKPSNILLPMQNAECRMQNERQKQPDGAGTVRSGENAGRREANAAKGDVHGSSSSHSAFCILHSALVPMITDFGLAKLLDADAVPHTHEDAILGTPPYMAPEQAAGRQAAIGRHTDVYALGAILYECLTGVPPFRGKNKLHTLDLVARVEPVPPSRRRAGVPADLERICLKCLEKQPEHRYATAQALADDLDSFLQERRPTGLPTRRQRIGRALRRWHAALTRTVRQPRAWLVALGVVALLGVGVRLVRPGREPPLPEAPGTPKPPLPPRTLVAGPARQLLGARGAPADLKPLLGGPVQRVAAADDSFTVRAATPALLELLSDPGHNDYRLTAQVRHRAAEEGGEVGLYVGRQSLGGGGIGDLFYTRAGFNDVRGGAAGTRTFDLAACFSPRAVLPPDLVFTRFPGPALVPAGEGQTDWRDVEITVTAEALAIRCGQERSEISLEQWLQRLKAWDPATQPPIAGRPALPRAPLMFHRRGGLGLYLQRGTASFRNVTLTPLVE